MLPSFKARQVPNFLRNSRTSFLLSNKSDKFKHFFCFYFFSETFGGETSGSVAKCHVSEKKEKQKCLNLSDLLLNRKDVLELLPTN